jgi:hypothetical protein
MNKLEQLANMHFRLTTEGSSVEYDVLVELIILLMDDESDEVSTVDHDDEPDAILCQKCFRRGATMQTDDGDYMCGDCFMRYPTWRG